MIDNQELAQASLVLLSVAIKLNQSWQILNLFHGHCILLEISPLKFSFASSLNILTPPMNSVKIYWPYMGGVKHMREKNVLVLWVHKYVIEGGRGVNMEMCNVHKFHVFH